MSTVLIKFKEILKDEIFSFFFEGFEGVYSRWELPCEYLSGPHFASWNGILLYSDGKALFSLAPGSEISESKYFELLSIIDSGKRRLKEIQNRERNL